MRINFKNLLIVSIIFVCTFIIISIYATTHNFYTVKQIKDQNIVLVSGRYYQNLNDKNDPKGFKIESSVKKKGLYGMSSVFYDLTNLDDTKDSTIYNTFHVKDLEPLSTYNVEVAFNLDAYESNTRKINVGFINYTPESSYDAKQQRAYNNITLNLESNKILNSQVGQTSQFSENSETRLSDGSIVEGKHRFINTFKTLNLLSGTNRYQINLEFTTNELGEGYLVIALKQSAKDLVDYNLGQVNYKILKKEIDEN